MRADRIRYDSGTGEADLHVRFGAVPTTGLYDCRPYPFGNNETCAAPGGLPLAVGGGDYFAMPHAFGAINGVALKGSYATRYGFPTQFASTGAWNTG
jgi:vibriolysin